MKTPNLKTVISLILLIVFICLFEDIYARAGGGGGGKGKGGIFALIAWAIYTAIVTTILFIKTSKSNFILRWSYRNDKIWESSKMKAFAKSIFLKMQQAWMYRDIDSVKEFISKDLYDDYEEQLDIMKVNKVKNILEAINVSDIKIISCEDYQDNSKDSFIAYIKGSVIDYTISEETQRVIKNVKKEEERFTDTYHFIRHENKWILNHIDNDVTIGDLIRASNYKER
jgi:hypothetical protein